MESDYKNSYCFKHFLFLGVHPDHDLCKLRIVFNMLMTAVFVVLVSIQFCLTLDPGLLEPFNAFFIITIKYVTMVFSRPKVKLILDTMEHFWNTDVCDNHITFCIKYYQMVENIFKIIFCLVILSYGTRPFISGGSMYNCYMPPQIPSPIFYVAELYILVVAISCFIAFNIFVCSLIVLVVIQFRLLNLKIKDVGCMEVQTAQDLKNFKQNFRIIAMYQKFLVKYVDEMNNLISLPVAFLMVTSAAIVCISMYVIALRMASPFDLVRMITIIFAVVAEFFMVFGLPAQLLMDESTSTADMLYFEVKWYTPKLFPLRKDLLIMMIRSQKAVYLRVADYHILNNRTILIILKTAYTFAAFLKRVENVKNN